MNHVATRACYIDPVEFLRYDETSGSTTLYANDQYQLRADSRPRLCQIYRPLSVPRRRLPQVTTVWG